MSDRKVMDKLPDLLLYALGLGSGKAPNRENLFQICFVSIISIDQ